MLSALFATILGTIITSIVGVVGTVAGVAGSIGSQAMANKQNRKLQEEANKQNIALQEKTNQQNKELAELSYQRNYEQWQRENEYNLPVNQMQRFKDAGLNPNLVYGQSSVSASSPSMSYTANSAPSISAARVSPVSFDAGSVLSATSGLIDTLFKARQADNEQKLFPYQLEQAKAQAEKETVEAKYTESLMLQDLASRRQSLINLGLTADNLRKDIVIKDKNGFILDSQLRKINQEIKNLIGQNKLTSSQIAHYNASTDYLRTQNDYKAFELNLAKNSFYPDKYQQMEEYFNNFYSDKENSAHMRNVYQDYINSPWIFRTLFQNFTGGVSRRLFR